MAFNKSAWYSGGVAIQGTKVLVFWYTRNARRVLKFPGGSQKNSDGRHDKTPVETVQRELVDDHEMLESGQIKVVDRFWTNPISSEHVQNWFIVEPIGALRTTEKLDREEGAPDELLSAPFWMEIKDVYEHHDTARLHKEMIPHLIAYMAVKSPEWGWIFQKLNVEQTLEIHAAGR